MNQIGNQTMIFNIQDYGAKPGSSTLNTESIQSTIDACHAAGGGTVLVPNGVFLTGTLWLRSHVNLHLAPQAVLLGSDQIDHYPLTGEEITQEMRQALIIAVNAIQVSITGRGAVDGQGASFPCGTEGFNWEDEEKAPAGEAKPRPNLVHIENCEDVLFRDLTLRNSACFNALIVDVNGLRIEDVCIRSRSNQNTDGFHIAGCENVFITGCDIDCGDDAFPFSKSARNVVISDCIITTRWAAFRFGPWSPGIFENIAISNCVVHNTYGCAVKMQEVEGGTMRNISFNNLIIENTTGPVSIRLGGYLGWKGDRQESLPIGVFENVRFSNIRATVADNSYPLAHEVVRMPGEVRSCININAVPGYYVEGVTFSNCHFSFPGGGTAEEAARRDVPELRNHYPEYHMFGTLPSYALYARHVRGLVLEGVTFDLASADLRPAIVCDDVSGLELSHVRLDGSEGQESLLRFSHVQDAFVHDCRALSPARAFIRLEGQFNDQVLVKDNDLRLVEVLVDREEGVLPGAVLLQ